MSTNPIVDFAKSTGEIGSDFALLVSITALTNQLKEQLEMAHARGLLARVPAVTRIDLTLKGKETVDAALSYADYMKEQVD